MNDLLIQKFFQNAVRYGIISFWYDDVIMNPRLDRPLLSLTSAFLLAALAERKRPLPKNVSIYANEERRGA